jgi:uncharacterized protein with ParB-like and HNH nuclease domain
MMRVWKIGSRWSETGRRDASIIDVFRRNQIIFAGDDSKHKLFNVKKGDLIAIADGTRILSIAMAVSEKAFVLTPDNCNQYIHVEPWDKFSEINFYQAVAIKVQIFDLSTPIEYVRTRTFCSIWHSETRHDILEAYEISKRKTFDIKTAVYRLLDTRGENTKLSLLGTSKSSYVIPIYQRPYSWGEIQIERFINDLFRGYWGDSEQKEIRKIPMFIGNMQLSARKYFSQYEWRQDVIDGQQRITTMFLILKYLYISYPKAFEKLGNSIRFNFLHTHVTDEENKLQFVESLHNMVVENGEEVKIANNQYYANLMLIKSNIDTIIKEYDRDHHGQFNTSDLLDYILNDIYFVVVETEATLSETISIFNTINTAGMDLNSGDLFKLRMSEYLVSRSKVVSIDEAFQHVDKLYKRIDELNIQYDKRYSILTILANYQDYIIAKYDLRKNLYRVSADRFFDQLLDGLLNIKIWDGFSKAGTDKIDLNLDDLAEFIEIQYEWDTFKFRDAEEMFARAIIRTTRYREYKNLVYLILKHYPQNYDYAYNYIKTICKLFIINSLYYDKQVNFMHRFMYGLREKIIKSSFDEIIMDINKEISESHMDRLYSRPIENFVGGYIADSDMRKNLLCRISEYLCEQKYNVPVDRMHELLFRTEFDIEHIHANADSSIVVGDIKVQNSIGNLVLLERKINRSIQDDNFTQKKQGYKYSGYSSIANICKLDCWTENEILKRKQTETENIINYLFN